MRMKIVAAHIAVRIHDHYYRTPTTPMLYSRAETISKMVIYLWDLTANFNHESLVLHALYLNCTYMYVRI